MNRKENNDDKERLLNQDVDTEIEIDTYDDGEDGIGLKIQQAINIPTPQPSQPSPSTSQQKQESSFSTIASVIAFYFVISITLVFLNKTLMSDFNFEYPLFITWYQQIISFISIYIMTNISSKVPALSFFPAFEFKRETAIKVLPVTIVLTGMIIFNNLCLEYVEVSFYQIARSLTICFSIIFTYLILKTKTSYRATLACLVVFLGFILGSVGEVNFSWKGIVFGLLSSCFVALYSIYVKKVLPACDGNEWRLSIYNTAISIVLMFPLLIISGEASTIMGEKLLHSFTFWVYMTIAGICGYLISISVFMQIKHTSPLTNNISGTVKACVQTILAVMIWGNKITFQNGLGIAIVIGGSFWYSFIRYQEMRK
ncbi:hypothetical protein DICPUDRAFT_27239 [Dictyostelium purpureum]|uniref:Sugar phosphate transporter domain-containing protein n=1 Tax=Dictyostelium purpureum TaxID=5786 RepID=F0Z9U2_DICPU|nr:uncharacterized protein DICPUDRAFT_27239 [Dictyostelium purpureum]EGC39272.1 hypothetical protein DICPUDRAFT_27239 [Dictyostelium purpureum]|eukprot:XP_003284176.1 hypothetical protein DICPUDRAFT_27239 [Dictyostelium purpureum]